MNKYDMRFIEFINKREIDKKLIDNFGKYKVYQVNGEHFRGISQSANEFTDFAIHKLFPNIIPKNEIWIDDSIKRPNDLLITITQALTRQRLEDNGDSKSYEKALAVDKKMREILDGLPFRPERVDKPGPPEVYTKKYGVIDDGTDKITVWLVNAEVVRDEFKSDYVEGGHGYVYKWIPNNEIWIEDKMHAHEIPLVLVHEFVERELMKYSKMSYNKAHTIASKVDFYYYEKGLSKKEVLSLNKEKAFALARKFGSDAKLASNPP